MPQPRIRAPTSKSRWLLPQPSERVTNVPSDLRDGGDDEPLSHNKRDTNDKKVRFKLNHIYKTISETHQSWPRPATRTRCKRTKHKGKSGAMDKLNILYANARGISGKIESLTSALQTHNTHIATITETKLGGIPPRVKGYSWIQKNKKRGEGGVAILIRDDLKNKVKIPTFLEDNEIEILWVQIDTKHTPTFIGTFYGAQANKGKDELD